MKDLETIQVAESYCVFQVGGTLFALAAEHLRELALRPPLANIPNSHRTLAGLWHEGSEFLPVLRLPTQGPDESRDSERQMLVIMGSQSTWGLLVDRVHGIERLNSSTNHAESFCDGLSNAQIGTARRNEQLVRILNGDGVYRLIEQDLKQAWSTS